MILQLSTTARTDERRPVVRQWSPLGFGGGVHHYENRINNNIDFGDEQAFHRRGLRVSMSADVTVLRTGELKIELVCLF